MMYEKIVRPLLFRFTDPEKIHHATIRALGYASRKPGLNKIFSTHFQHVDPALHVAVGKLNLENPIGLAAGFDKYIEAPLSYAMLGFGFAELGSVTWKSQPGNPKPRVWRLPKDKGIIVNYGLSNDGAEATFDRLAAVRPHPCPLGISIAPTTGLSMAEMADDYIRSFSLLHSAADYVTFNVSCPNVASCSVFSQILFIEELTARIHEVVDSKKISTDLFLKIGPHHTQSELKKIATACMAHKLSGIIATNLIKKRDAATLQSSLKELNHPGGISGKILQKQSETVIKELYQLVGKELTIIGVGGVFTANDAYQKIKAGATAVQLITGFVYGGPYAIRSINQGLSTLLKNDGFSKISEAVGKDS